MMRDPHVAALSYQLETTEALLSFENPQPCEAETALCRFYLAEGMLTCTMKEHYPSPNEARGMVDPLLHAWVLADSLQRGRREIRFVFQRAEVIDRDPPPEGKVLSIQATETIGVSGRLSLWVTRADYPAFSQRFIVSPDVETLWNRYEGYVQGREPLPGMAYVCQSFIEKVLARGQAEAAQKYHIERKVLRTLGDLHSHRGDLTSRRKLEHERDRHEPCIFTEGHGRIPVTGSPDVIDRPASGPSRPQRRVGRHVPILAEPAPLSGAREPASDKVGPVRSEAVCPAVFCGY
jgi:hypothetical protein